jgi:hypothetical protein
MADELNTPDHRYYKRVNNVMLAPEDMSNKYIYPSGISRIDQKIAEGATNVVQANSGVMFLPGVSTYSDTDGLVHASVGDLVARIDCAAGSGKKAIFPASHRPVLARTSGDKYYLNPNGVDCYGVTDCAAGGIDAYTHVSAGSATGNGKIFAGCFAAPSTRNYVGVADGASAGLIGAGVNGKSWVDIKAAVGWTTLTVVSVSRSATSARLFVGGVLADTDTVSGSGTDLVAYIMAGNGDGTAFDFWTGPWYGWAATLTEMSTSDRQTVEQFFAGQIGG